MAGMSPRDVGFSQQGQVDWVSFEKGVKSLTVGLILRFQGAGVQHGTYLAITELSKYFSLSEKGEENLITSIRQQKTYCRWEALYFGFGERSLVMTLTDNAEGLKIITFCSSLSKMHSNNIAARVLSALLKHRQCPESYHPSHPQLLGFVKVCSGALAGSPFQEIVRHMLGPIRPWRPDDSNSAPIDLAKAMQGLFDIT